MLIHCLTVPLVMFINCCPALNVNICKYMMTSSNNYIKNIIETIVMTRAIV